MWLPSNKKTTQHHYTNGQGQNVLFQDGSFERQQIGVLGLSPVAEIFVLFYFLLDEPRLNPLILKRTFTLSKIQDGCPCTSCCVALWEQLCEK